MDVEATVTNQLIMASYKPLLKLKKLPGKELYRK
jgi:hypothetical protein